MGNPLDPSAILQTAFGFWNSKVLLTAVEMGLFTRLANQRLNAEQLGAELKLQSAPGEGTLVEIQVRLDEDEASASPGTATVESAERLAETGSPASIPKTSATPPVKS